MHTFEITNVIFFTKNGNVRRLGHVFWALNVLDKFPVLPQNENGRSDRVHSHNLAFPVYGQTGHNVNEPDRNPADEMTHVAENLHARPLAATVTDDKIARLPKHSHFARVPEHTLVFSWDSKGKFEIAFFVKYLKEKYIYNLL